MKGENDAVPSGDGRRMLDGDELGLLLLLQLKEGQGHGYDLIKDLKTRSGGNYIPSSGIVYPRLAMLVEARYVTVETKGKRRAYQLTAAGAEFLMEHLEEAHGVRARIEALRYRGSSVAAGPVGRAMQNLKTALGQKLAGEPDKDLLLAVAEIIDQAVHKIERL
ncbi:PadR family transcriptional regulator [Sinorhizobium americanum]|uniref:Transcriptional regulator, PadR family n=1 Tax=Sinorhizobium americanum TaxID=194963 RepID=A0A1L3LYR4_9HYPH|nr:PadR family transcriptional regulator [Sinorhizobium americanum]APG95240.1 transcriptional regulator, PadR family [Sinorhizobium americanum]OAP50125.1 hypothetical protein ATC00_09115 [Sinorhizobium americanum]